MFGMGSSISHRTTEETETSDEASASQKGKALGRMVGL